MKVTGSIRFIPFASEKEPKDAFDHRNNWLFFLLNITMLFFSIMWPMWMLLYLYHKGKHNVIKLLNSGCKSSYWRTVKYH